MDSIIVGMFDEADEAFAVVNDLEAKGVPSHHITVDTSVENEKAAVLRERSFLQKIGDAFSGRDRRILHEGVRRGNTVVTARVEDPLVEEAVAVMKEHGAVDIDERSAEWKEEGFRTQDTDPGTAAQLQKPQAEQPLAGQQAMQGQQATQGQQTMQGQQAQGQQAMQDQQTTRVPVVEEQLRVGKREVQHGGVRVYSHVIEQPVEEQVQLREEHIHIERRPVDKPVSGVEPGLFQEGSFEVLERAEEAVVGKEARVVEEVVVGKDVSERVETVRDTVRRTDVQVEKLGDSSQQSPQQGVNLQQGYPQLDDDFRQHYQQTFASGGEPYDRYASAYRYPWQFDQIDQYRDRPWDEVEPHLQRSWERDNPGTWEKFKDAIRYGWDRLTGKVTSSRST